MQHVAHQTRCITHCGVKRMLSIQARELGPFASARQLVEGRAAAMAARTDKILGDAKVAREKEEVRPPRMLEQEADHAHCFPHIDCRCLCVVGREL